MRAPVATVFLIAVVAAALTVPVGSAHTTAHVGNFATFDAALGEFPEGIAIGKSGTVYVGMADLGEIRMLAPDGSPRGVLATLAPGGLLLGLAVDARENVYAAVASFDPATHGVWRISADGAKTRLPGTESILLPNGLALDRKGNIYVSDSLLGAVWRVSRGGSAEIWLEHELLAGDGSLFGIAIGANGIALRHGSVFIANTDLGRIVRIPIGHGGHAGRPRVVAEGPALVSADGIALDVRGRIYVAVIAQSTLLRVGPHGRLATLATEANGLDSPASLAFGTGRHTRKTLFLTESPTEGPGIATVRVGIPGWPTP